MAAVGADAFCWRCVAGTEFGLGDTTYPKLWPRSGADGCRGSWSWCVALRVGRSVWGRYVAHASKWRNARGTVRGHGFSVLPRRRDDSQWVGGSSDAPLISPAENAAGTDSYFRDGFLIVFLNPKIMVFFVAVFSQFLTSSKTLMAQVYAASLAGVIDAVWYALVALLVSSGRVSEWLQRYRNRLDILFGLMLWGVSITILYGILNAY